jgi:hypothetical protein
MWMNEASLCSSPMSSSIGTAATMCQQGMSNFLALLLQDFNNFLASLYAESAYF